MRSPDEVPVPLAREQAAAKEADCEQSEEEVEERPAAQLQARRRKGSKKADAAEAL